MCKWGAGAGKLESGHEHTSCAKQRQLEGLSTVGSVGVEIMENHGRDETTVDTIRLKQGYRGRWCFVASSTMSMYGLVVGLDTPQRYV